MWSQIIRYQDPLKRLRKSKFRRSFKLTRIDKKRLLNMGERKIVLSIKEIVRRKLSDPALVTDGRQTPYYGHPVFVAQHATATCCRKCIFRWYRIPSHKLLCEADITKITRIIYRWLLANMNKT